MVATQRFFIFTPGEDEPILTCAYFSKGLVQPPTRQVFFFHSRSCWFSDPPGVTRVSGVTRLREQELTATLSARNSNRADNEKSRISAKCSAFFCLTVKMMKEFFKMVVHVSVGGDSKELHNDLDMSLIFLLLVGNK